MSTPINLNKVRKARARADKRTRADENAIRFGRSKAEKQNERATKEKAERRLDLHRRET